MTTWSTADQDGWAEDGISYYKYTYVYYVYECVRACVRARARTNTCSSNAHMRETDVLETTSFVGTRILLLPQASKTIHA